jgi:hypothetical protein
VARRLPSDIPSLATRVVDDEKPRVIANQVICLLQQGSFEWTTVPNSGGDEMMKLIVADLASAHRHR